MSLDTTKADDIALVIEEAIVSGELAPGTVLRQEQLSEQFNVSRTPVREALRRLAALGLVSFVPNRGVRVRTISRDELHEAFMVRAELESLATEVAATKITPEELAELDAAERRFAEISQAAARAGAGRGAALDHGRLGAREPRVPRRHLPRRRTCRSSSSSRRARGGRSPGRRSGRRATTRSTGSTRRTPSSIARSSRRSFAGSAAGARALAREHVLSSFHLLETILEQVGAQPRDWQRGRAARR